MIRVLLLIGFISWQGLAFASSDSQRFNDLDGLWNYYNYTYISEGRVISLDEGGITTSEGQSYGMLRAVWSGDRETFDSVWVWTQKNLLRLDNLFSWKWKNTILDRNAATDADTDIALALLLAAERFDDNSYKTEALKIIHAIWKQEVFSINGKHYITGGNWAPDEKSPTIHVGYLAPYAYEVFSRVDTQHAWQALISSSYEILDWIFLEQKLAIPPEKIYIRRSDGAFLTARPGYGGEPRFSYDVFPIYWRVATDEQWFSRGKVELRNAMLRFFDYQWLRGEKFFDLYSMQGEALSRFEALPLYATVASLARVSESSLTDELETGKLKTLWQKALAGNDTPYYLHNWLWFDRALELRQARSFSEFLSFLYPFDFDDFERYFPYGPLLLFLLLTILCNIVPARFNGVFRALALAIGFYLCGRYLLWRLEHSLNFIEPVGPYISIALLAAEFYCFSTVLLLLIQVGIRGRKPSSELIPIQDYRPTVDIFIPIYSESLEILEPTLMAAQDVSYSNKQVYVCDDSHREAVRKMAETYDAIYIKGPKKHAKAGNINNALNHSSGELVLIFDTDHLPVSGFLDETVPLLSDAKVGFVQTAHHFYNPDIFQNSLRTPNAVPDEQDFFHHGIQTGRDKWGGAFFVGTGAVFRRKALEDVGGLLLMSITEDIHTSQHIHAKGWESRYVGKNLAVGLNAENLSSYLLQRTRWMQGCLQVFFKDNPLIMSGLPFRHRLGYFASQYYFFFPIARVIFFAAPLFYLLFHWHPIFADLSTLLAYLLPFMICLPILSQLLVPGWPRLIWASAYENTISVALFRGIFDLVLPKKLSFKVTPKGISSDTSSFDFQSSKYSLVVFVITLFAILKGLGEFYYFGIEKDAYFFNLTWASINLILLITPLVIAREHPRHAYQNRIQKKIPLTLNALGFYFKGDTFDLDQTGFSVLFDKQEIIPDQVGVCFGATSQLSLVAKCSFYDRDDRGRKRAAFDFVSPDKRILRWILKNVHCDSDTWNDLAKQRTKSNVIMVTHFFNGLLKTLRKPQEMRRMQPRDKILRIKRLRFQHETRWALITNQSRLGLRAYLFGSGLASETLQINIMGSLVEYRTVNSHGSLPGLHRLGLAKK